MSVLERAWLYVTRKRGKTLVIFCIFLIMSTAIISGISIKKAAQAAMQQARESVGGNFTMMINYDKSNPNIKQKQVEEEVGGKRVIDIQTFNEGPPLTKEVAEKVGDVDGISYVNGSATLFLDNCGLTHITPPKQDNIANFGYNGGGSDIKIPNLQLNIAINSQNDPSFKKGDLKLIEGRHITSEDKNKVLIHKEFAEKNDLKAGDTIPLLMMQKDREKYGTDDTPIKVEIVGLFETAKKSESYNFMAFSLPENTLISDVDTGKILTGRESFEFDTLTFGIEDPKNIESIVEDVKTLDLDWRQFTIDTHDAEYKQIAGPIENLNSMITMILYAIYFVSCIILTLILSLWIKGRIHETGILLSLGIHKSRIIMQYTLELLFIAVFAFTLSYFSGKAVSQTIGNTMIAQMIEQEETKNKMEDSSVSGGVSIGTSQPIYEKIEELNVQVSEIELIYVYCVGCIVIILSVLLSSIPILRLKPKEILSRMS